MNAKRLQSKNLTKENVPPNRNRTCIVFSPPIWEITHFCWSSPPPHILHYFFNLIGHTTLQVVCLNNLVIKLKNMWNVCCIIYEVQKKKRKVRWLICLLNFETYHFFKFYYDLFGAGIKKNRLIDWHRKVKYPYKTDFYWITKKWSSFIN